MLRKIRKYLYAGKIRIEENITATGYLLLIKNLHRIFTPFSKPSHPFHIKKTIINVMENQTEQKIELKELCNQIRFLIPRRAYEKCEILLGEAMQKYPHAPHPHNLFGILLEDKGDHSLAMNHFRAALALDAVYKPAQHNLSYYGNFKKKGKCAYDETDCINEEEYTIKIDELGAGKIVRK